MRKTRIRRKRSYKRVIILGLILLAAAAAFGAKHFFGQEEAVQDFPIADKGECEHIMVMGVDRRADDVGRSDTLFVVTVNKEDKKAALLSVPRDTWVAVEGHDYDKVNHAYAYGGHSLTQKTLESLLGVKMDHYVLIDIKAFERIIDAIGGVDIDVEKRMYYEDPWDDNGGLVIDLYPGEQHMDGQKAIQYVRYRDGEGDIGRIGRQQKFMRAVLDKVISPSVLPKLPAILKEVSSAVETDMSLTEMAGYLDILQQVRENGLKSAMLPGKPSYLEDISYWLPDIKSLRQMVAEEMGKEFSPELQQAADKLTKEYVADMPKDIKVIEDSSKAEENNSGQKNTAKENTPAKPEEIAVLVINSSGINGAGAEVAGILQRKGFIISGVETGLTSSREKTTITTSDNNTDLFYGMPFTCTIMSGGDRNQAVVNIGLDYAGGRQSEE